MDSSVEGEGTTASNKQNQYITVTVCNGKVKHGEETAAL
jgi:hypothetical protein